MSKRDILRKSFVDIIENQIEGKLDKSTIKLYKELLEQGVDEERAVELLAFYLETYLKHHFDEKFDNKKWKNYLCGLQINTHLGEYDFDRSDERRNLRLIQRKFGELKNDTGLLEDELMVIEGHLLTIHKMYQISANEAKKIIHIGINRLLDEKDHVTSSYHDYAHEDILCLADGFDQCFNPYVNPALKEFLEKHIPVIDDNYDKIFKNIFLCLTRILKSIDLFEKELGKDGYFRFIEQFINLDACIEEGPTFFFFEDTINK